MQSIRSVGEMVDALGGSTAVAEIVGTVPSAVSNWRARDRVPAEHFFVLSDRLAAAGLNPDRSLFGFSAVEARA